jgi:2-dehydropantoate 2-reductase
MRILVYGAGVIGANLAADLVASGRDVTLLARGAWADTLAQNGLTIRPVFSVNLPLRRAFPAALGLGTARGVLDEVQQAFVPGRSCEFRDMCIDAAGVLLGAAFLLLILHLIQRKKLKR